LAFNLYIVRRSVEQIAAKQDEMAQSIATLQAVEEDIRQKTTSRTSSVAPQAFAVLQQKPLQPRVPSSGEQSSSMPCSRAPTGGQRAAQRSLGDQRQLQEGL
jgi:hypothetical protein